MSRERLAKYIMTNKPGRASYVNSAAFSHDSRRLASASVDHTVKIYDAGSGACLQTLNIGKGLFKISFNTTGSCLHTNIGIIAIDTSSVSDTTQVLIKRDNPQCQGAGLSSNREWIAYNSELYGFGAAGERHCPDLVIFYMGDHTDDRCQISTLTYVVERSGSKVTSPSTG